MYGLPLLDTHCSHPPYFFHTQLRIPMRLLLLPLKVFFTPETSSGNGSWSWICLVMVLGASKHAPTEQNICMSIVLCVWPSQPLIQQHIWTQSSPTAILCQSYSPSLPVSHSNDSSEYTLLFLDSVSSLVAGRGVLSFSQSPWVLHEWLQVLNKYLPKQPRTK